MLEQQANVRLVERAASGDQVTDEEGYFTTFVDGTVDGAVATYDLRLVPQAGSLLPRSGVTAITVGTAGEVGHICVEPNGHPCGCGSRGCIEQYASATAIIRSAINAGLEVGSSSAVYEAAKSGDKRASAVFSSMGSYLGIGLAGLVNVLNPEMIVLGGGVSAAWDLFADEVRREVNERAFPEPADRVKIVRAELGDDAGILGAARAVFASVRRGAAN